jgi:drug/metabolite transporter (DMT)-like permease
LATGRGHAWAFPALIAGSSALAFGPLFVRQADVTPLASAFWRLALAAPLLALMAAMSGGAKPRGGRGWGLLAVAGLFFASDIATWHAGIVRTSLANATLFGNVSSFFFAAWGFIVARAWPGRRFLSAVTMAVLGIGLLLGESAELSPRNLTGDLLSIGAALLYVGYLVIIDRERASVAPLPALAVATLAGACLLGPLAVAFGQPMLARDWTPLLLLAFGSQVVGQGLIVFAVGHLKPEVSGLGLLTQPVVAAAIGWGWLGERPAPVQAVGALLVLGALVVARWPNRRPVRASAEPLG